jgi:hypothetical protein
MLVIKKALHEENQRKQMEKNMKALMRGEVINEDEKKKDVT